MYMSPLVSVQFGHHNKYRLYDEMEVYTEIYYHRTIGVLSMKREGVHTGFQGDNKSSYNRRFIV